MLEAAGVRVDVAMRQVTVDGERVDLAPKMFDLLLILLREPRVVHRREALFDRLWPGGVLLDANLTNTVSALRRALGPVFRDALRTVPRIGYALDADVQRSDVAATVPPPSATTSTSISPSASPEGDAADAASPMPPQRARPASSRRRWAWLAAVAVVLLAIAAIVRWQMPTPRPLVVLGRFDAAGDPAVGRWAPEALREALALALALALRRAAPTTGLSSAPARTRMPIPTHRRRGRPRCGWKPPCGAATTGGRSTSSSSRAAAPMRASAGVSCAASPATTC